jgi:predicted  nucleic acid-binding Zn-ribbon protein
MDRANEEVLRVLEHDVLHPNVIATVVRKAVDKFRTSEREWKERREALHKQISSIDIELGRLVAAISSGGDIPALVAAVKIANDRRTVLSQDLAEVDSQQHSDADYDQLEKEPRAHFEASWQTILTRLFRLARSSENFSARTVSPSSP